MTIQEEIMDLLHRVPKPPGYTLPAGIDLSEISHFEARTKIALPENLCRWLTLCNGPLVGPGGIFGIRTSTPSLDLEALLRLFPIWKSLQWVPVAGDGCGSYYVLDNSHHTINSYPIYFVDHEGGYEVPAYVVASDLWHFLRFLLANEIYESKWPFDKPYVTAQDPAIIELEGLVPFPWSTTSHF